MPRHGLIRALQTTSEKSSRTVRPFAAPETELEAMKKALSKFKERQRLMNRIGQDLTSLSDRERLLERAAFYLRNDLSYPHAKLRFFETGDGPRLLQEAEIRKPVECNGRVFGTIVISKIGRFAETDREILKTFAGFLAVALGNVKRLEEAQSLASTDPLTGIPNRRKLLDVGGQTLGRNKFTGVIVFDVDHLKAINDVFGHLAGDAVLKVVADRAKECVRKTDVLIRYGGDEFLILLPETRRHAVLEIAERLRNGVQSSQLEIQGRHVSATISVGFACLRGELNFSRLIRSADQALFAAKQRGRNRVCGSEGVWMGSRESLA